MWSNLLEEILTNHKGKFFGLLIGLVMGFLIISLGIWHTLVVILISALGYYIGKRVDEEGSFKEFLNKILGGH